MPSSPPSRRVPFEGATNFRDLGGYQSAPGTQTRWGRLYRADGLNRLTETDMVTFGELGIRAVYDLRGDAERTEEPDPMDSVQIALLNRHPSQTGPTPLGTTTALEGEQVLKAVYVGMLAHSAHLFGQLFSSLTDQDRLPAVFHCAGGKDRTGMAAALLLSCLGVDRETVLDDYELSAKWRTIDDERPLYNGLIDNGVTPAAAQAFLGSPRWAMAHTLQLLDIEYDGIDGYLLGPAGLDTATLDNMRRLFLE